MPIVIDRYTGKIISCPEITQQQRNKLWEVYVNKWMDKYPDKVREFLFDQNIEETPERGE